MARNERWEELLEQIRAAAFAALDSEVGVGGDDAGAVAAAVESAARAKLIELGWLDAEQ